MKMEINSNYINDLLSDNSDATSYKYRVVVYNKQQDTIVTTMYMNLLSEMSENIDKFYSLFNCNRSSFYQNVYVGKSNTPLDASRLASLISKEVKSSINEEIIRSVEVINASSLEEEEKNLLIKICTMPNTSITEASRMANKSPRQFMRAMAPHIESNLLEIVSEPRGGRKGGIHKRLKVKIQ